MDIFERVMRILAVIFLGVFFVLAFRLIYLKSEKELPRSDIDRGNLLRHRAMEEEEEKEF